MEFNNLSVKNNNFGKPAWQDCNPIVVASCIPAEQASSFAGKNYYYHKVELVTADGNMVHAQFVANDQSGVQPGEHKVQVQVKLYQGKKTFLFRNDTNNTNNNSTNNTKVMSNEFRTPEQIMRGVACEVASKVSSDEARFWGVVQQVYSYINTGDMPI